MFVTEEVRVDVPVILPLEIVTKDKRLFFLTNLLPVGIKALWA